MRRIQLTHRQARLLRDNLTSSIEGYDYIDLRRLDAIANKLSGLMGAYGERRAELARTERQARRTIARNENAADVEAANKALQDIQFEVEDMDEEASAISGVLVVSDTDHRLIADKLDSVDKWIGNDDLRPVIIGMVEAVRTAEAGEPDESDDKVKQLRRRP